MTLKFLKYNSWRYITLAAAAMLMITMGARRRRVCLFFRSVDRPALVLSRSVSPWRWGSSCGGWRSDCRSVRGDRFGAPRVLIGGVLLLALGTALTPVFYQQFRLGGYDWNLFRHRLRRGEFFGHDRPVKHRLAPRERATASRAHHRRRILRPVSLCADYPGVNLDLGLDGRYVVLGAIALVGIASGQAVAADRASCWRVRRPAMAA